MKKALKKTKVTMAKAINTVHKVCHASLKK